MRKIVIMHSVAEAKHCIQHEHHIGAELYSTHSSVDVFLKEYHRLECLCLSHFLTRDRIGAIIQETDQKVAKILNRLDTNNRDMLQIQFGVPMNWFTALYDFYARIQYSGYIFFVESLKNVVGTSPDSNIVLYNYTFKHILPSETDIKALMNMFFPEFNIRVIQYEDSRLSFRQLWDKVRRHSKKLINPKRWMQFVQILARFQDRQGAFDSDKETVLLLGPLYEMEFLREGLAGNYNVINGLNIDVLRRNFPLGTKSSMASETLKFDFRLDGLVENSYDELLLKDLIACHRRTDHMHTEDLRILQSIYSKYGIDLVVWGNPPKGRIFGLFNEYLRRQGVKVVGAQHGAVYGDCVVPKHYLSDYDRCDYYFTYGFTEKDLIRGLPGRKVRCRTVPVGKCKFVQHDSDAREVDIVFPVTNTKSMFWGGMWRVAPHELTARQIRILEHLDSLTDATVYIKPFANANYDNCSVLPVLRRLKHVKIVDHIGFHEFLCRFKPRCTIVEMPSTPQFEVLHLDTEVLLMDEWFDVYEERALDMLQARVHFTTNTEQMIDCIDDFIAGRLCKKRDDTYFRYYCHESLKPEQILALLKQIMSGVQLPTDSRMQERPVSCKKS